MNKNLKVSELKQLCKEKGIQGYSKKKKEELLAMLNKTVEIKTHHIQKTDPENSLALFIPYKSELIEIRRTEDWWVNITEISKKLGKDFKYWKKDNKHTIATFEQMANQAVLYETGGRYSQTFDSRGKSFHGYRRFPFHVKRAHLAGEKSSSYSMSRKHDADTSVRKT